MLVYLWLYFFRVGEPTLAGFIAAIDFITFLVASAVAVVVFLTTDPKNDFCLARDTSDHLPVQILRTIYLGLLFFYLIVNRNWKRFLRLFAIILGRLCFCGRTATSQRLVAEEAAYQRSMSFIERAVNGFFNRWVYVMTANIAIWTQPAFEQCEDIRTASINFVIVIARAYAVLRLVYDACKLFTGKFDGMTVRDHHTHRAVHGFAALWANCWIFEVFYEAITVFFAGWMVYIGYGGRIELTDRESHFNSLIELVVNGATFLLLVALLGLVQRGETEILSYSKQAGLAKSTGYAATYLELTRFFDVVKMVLATQYITIFSTAQLVFYWLIVRFDPNPISQVLLCGLSVGIPPVYCLVSTMLKGHAYTDLTRKIVIWLCLLMTFVACSAIGAFRGCDKLQNFNQSGTIDLDTYDYGESFLVYLAKTFAMPTVLGFGLVFITSPSAARFSSAWYSLPLIFRWMLAPMPWLSPHLLQELHVASGTIFFSCGCYHTLSYIILYAVKFLTGLTDGIAVALATGLAMLLLSVKLLWPPGMLGWSARIRKPWNKSLYARLQTLDNFLKDSKYGYFHVYIANIVLTLFIVHAMVNMYPRKIWYWSFPVITCVLLFFLHPAKSAYLSTLFQRYRSVDTFDRSYQILRKTCTPIRPGTLTSVKLRLRLPTFEPQFAEIMENKEYTGYCDVILIKFLGKLPERSDKKKTDGGGVVARGDVERAKKGDGKEAEEETEREEETRMSMPWSLTRELESVHYYSTVNISVVSGGVGGVVEADLMIQRTGRKAGCSAALMNAADTEGQAIQVLGFVKSNALESLRAPGIVAFGWESGAAAFCSLFKQRKLQRVLRKEIVAARMEERKLRRKQIRDQMKPTDSDASDIDSDADGVSSSVSAFTTAKGGGGSVSSSSRVKAIGTSAISAQAVDGLRRSSSDDEDEEGERDDSVVIRATSETNLDGTGIGSSMGAPTAGIAGSSAVVSPIVQVQMVRSPDLLVVWTTFMRSMRRHGGATAPAIAKAVRELVNVQQFMYKQCGGKGNKIIFIATGVPAEWVPEQEQLTYGAKDLQNEVASELLSEARRPKFGLSFADNQPAPTHTRQSHARVAGKTASGVMWSVQQHQHQHRGGTTQSPFHTGETELVSLPIKRRSGADAADLVALPATASSFESSFSLGAASAEGVGGGGEGRAEIMDVEAERASLQASKEQLLEVTTTTATTATAREDQCSFSNFSAGVACTDVRAGVGAGVGAGASGVRSAREAEMRQMGRGKASSVSSAKPASLETAPNTSETTTTVAATASAAAEVILRLHERPECWVSVRRALTSTWKQFKASLNKNVTTALLCMHEREGPDYLTFFVPEHESDVDALREFKYSKIYDQVNKALIYNQVRYQKNPGEFMRQEVEGSAFHVQLQEQLRLSSSKSSSKSSSRDQSDPGALPSIPVPVPVPASGDTRIDTVGGVGKRGDLEVGGLAASSSSSSNRSVTRAAVTSGVKTPLEESLFSDPIHASPVCCHVLYSGDYASSKLDQLKTVVDKVAYKQRLSTVPASLLFVPDA